MLFKKKTEQGDKSGVKMINGSVQFQAVYLNVHCFEVDGILIDTGSASLLKQFKPFFEQMDVDRIMLTHYHEDHSGGAHFLQKAYKLPIFFYNTTLSQILEIRPNSLLNFCTTKSRYVKLVYITAC